MSPHTPTRRRATVAVITATALTIPLLAAVPAQAAPCGVGDKEHASCNGSSHTPGTSGGGGTGGGGSGGPFEPPDPVGLTADEGDDFVPVPGGPPVAAAPATADLLEEAQDATVFPTPVVHTAPNGKTYVGLRTSLWVEGFRNVQTEPITFGAQTVQLIATPKSVRWALGEKDGAKEKVITCPDAGNKDGKTCNYRYRRSSAAEPGGKYQITATITWDVKWTCEGDDCDSPGGNLAPNPVSSQPTPLLVSEIQTNTGR